MNHLVLRSPAGSRTRDMAQRIKRLAPDLSCTACGHRDFAILEDVDENIRTVLRRQPYGGGPSAHFVSQPLVTLLCTHCGRLEQFAEAILKGAEPAEYGSEVRLDE
ncbi:hypothetical protein [Prosthecodimorpha staleyi]|uniref:Uncharacterized protein n=1 Tax=Prosthecodimorpha staleyi TaxID=2840188 RepID=A0A947D1A9_9HYPH|nr:hypothetical protein [Prosthecodimorpha staleyi]MBT9288811.1 hypothetical protein [Prosthecodimorpha staleyi]